MSANVVFMNGQVITVDRDFSVVEALAVKDNKIVFVGSNVAVKDFIDSGTHVIDLKGKSLLPGFIDAHAHLTIYGTNQLGVNCKDANSIDEIKRKLAKVASKTPKGQWIRGWGYNDKKLAEQRHPTKDDLDAVSTEHPIVIVRTCSHISVVNTYALDIGNISSETPDPPGGKIVKENGQPNGLLLESAHMAMLQLSQYTEEEVFEGLAIASNHFVKWGITSVHDAGAYGNDHFRLLQRAVKQNKVKQRVYTMVGALHDAINVVKRALAAGMITDLGNERFKIGPAKVFIDGSSSGPTAATREPYTSNPNDSGILYMSQTELDDILEQANALGWQITAHAMGDKAVEMMINCIEKTSKISGNGNPLRHRIEHAGMTPPDLLKRMKELNIIPVSNPAFIFEFGDGYINDYGERVESMFPLGAYHKAGVTAAIGSDSPITDHNPLIGIHTALNRITQGGQIAGHSQRTGIKEMIKMYTWNGAYASFEEDIKGSLESGKLADLVVLDRPILNIPTDEIKNITVELTMINGEIIYGQV